MHGEKLLGKKAAKMIFFLSADLWMHGMGSNWRNEKLKSLRRFGQNSV